MDLEVKKGKWGRMGCLIFLAIIILTPCLYIGGRYLMNLLEVRERGETIVKLLDETYKDKFAIAEGHYNWGNDSYQFTAYPVNEPDFKFSVLISRLSKSGISCSYLFLRQVYNLEKQVKPVIDEVTEKNLFLANIGPATYMNSEDSREFYNFENAALVTSPDILLKKFPYLLKNYTGITYCYDVTDENKGKIAKAIYKLLSFYREKEFGLIHISITFFDSRLWEDINFKNGVSPGSPFIWGNSNIKSKYSFHVSERFTDTQKIENYKDIEKQIVKTKIREE